MIPHQYVKLETARLLKEAGFPQYEDNGVGQGFSYDHGHLGNYIRTKYDDDEVIAAPTQAQAMKWLRDEKRVWVEITKNRGNHRIRVSVWEYGCYGSYTLDGGSFHPAHGDKQIGVHAHYDNYEEAVESGIQTACRNVIEKSQID